MNRSKLTRSPALWAGVFALLLGGFLLALPWVPFMGATLQAGVLAKVLGALLSAFGAAGIYQEFKTDQLIREGLRTGPTR